MPMTWLISFASLYDTSCYPHITGRDRCSSSGKSVEDLAERRRHCSESGPLRLSLPFRLLPGFSAPLCATWDRNAFSTPLALGKQDSLL